MDKMKICKKLYGYLPNSIMRFIEKKVGNKDIKTLLQSIRLEKFPIYGTLSNEMQSSAFHLYLTSQLGYISLAIFSRKL